MNSLISSRFIFTRNCVYSDMWARIRLMKRGERPLLGGGGALEVGALVAWLALAVSAAGGCQEPAPRLAAWLKAGGVQVHPESAGEAEGGG